MTSRLTVTVDTTALTEPFDVQWNESLNRLGSFSFSLTNDDAQNSACTLGAPVAIDKDGLTVFYGVIESIRQVDADDSEHQVTTFSGRSIIAELERVAVFPAVWPVAGYGQTAGRDVCVSPWDRVRLFGYPDPLRASELTGSVTADNVTAVTAERPVGWPDPTPSWIGDSGGADVIYSVGIIDELDAAGRRAAIFVATTGITEVYLQGVPILVVRADEVDSTSCYRVDTAVTPGVDQVYVVKVSKLGTANPKFALTYHDPDSADPKFLFRTGTPYNSWSLWADPTTPPGTTPGKMVLDIIGEYETRREPLGWNVTFDAEVDSAGDAWPTVPIFPCQVGESLIDVLERLSGAWVDFGVEVDAGTRTLSMWNAEGVDAPGGTGTGRGSASGVTLAVGTNVLELVHEVTSV